MKKEEGRREESHRREEVKEGSDGEEGKEGALKRGGRGREIQVTEYLSPTALVPTLSKLPRPHISFRTDR